MLHIIFEVLWPSLSKSISLKHYLLPVQEVRDMMESIRRGAYNPREAVRWHWVDGPDKVLLVYDKKTTF